MPAPDADDTAGARPAGVWSPMSAAGASCRGTFAAGSGCVCVTPGGAPRAAATNFAASASGRASALASNSADAREGRRVWPRSRLLIVRALRPDRSASSSCVNPAATRYRCSTPPNADGAARRAPLVCPVIPHHAQEPHRLPTDRIYPKRTESAAATDGKAAAAALPGDSADRRQQEIFPLRIPVEVPGHALPYRAKLSCSNRQTTSICTRRALQSNRAHLARIGTLNPQ